MLVGRRTLFEQIFLVECTHFPPYVGEEKFRFSSPNQLSGTCCHVSMSSSSYIMLLSSNPVKNPQAQVISQ